MTQPDEDREYAEIAKDCLTSAELDEIAEHLAAERKGLATNYEARSQGCDA